MPILFLTLLLISCNKAADTVVLGANGLISCLPTRMCSNVR